MKEIFVLILIGSILIVAQNQPLGVVCNENIANCITRKIIDSGSSGIERCGCVKCDKEHHLVIDDYPFLKEDNITPDVLLWGTKCVKFCNNSKDSEVNFQLSHIRVDLGMLLRKIIYCIV